MAAQFWLVKQEPDSYAWTTFVAEGKTLWTGVRNFQARNNLRAMNVGDKVLYYHSGDEKRVVGVAEVSVGPKADPTADEGDWTCVELRALKALVEPVPLAVLKSDDALKEMTLIRNTRLSVTPVTPPQFRRILELGKTKA
jgi:predicted RNA-binding protein with PUA-like domain